MTSATHGISSFSIYDLKSLSGSFTITHTLVSNFALLNGLATLTYRGLGVYFSGTFSRVQLR